MQDRTEKDTSDEDTVQISRYRNCTLLEDKLSRPVVCGADSSVIEA